MAARVQRGRLAKELGMMSAQPPPGVTVWPQDGDMGTLEVELEGPPDSPYENGFFRLRVTVPDRYPFQPPNVRFVTPIYHPNIDSGGRICLDTLNMPPKGAWVPALNLSSVLSTIRLLLGSPNADDGLMPEITKLYKVDRPRFVATARAWTQRHAQRSSDVATAAVPTQPKPAAASPSSGANDKERPAAKSDTVSPDDVDSEDGVDSEDDSEEDSEDDSEEDSEDDDSEDDSEEN